MKNRILKSAPFAGIAVAALLMWGCGDNNKSQPSPAQQQANATAAAEDNSQMIAATQEMMDVTAGAFAEKGITSGRTISEGRLGTSECLPSVSGNFKLDTSFPDSLIYSGSVTIDYGTGSSCPNAEHVRSGKITDTFLYAIGKKGGKYVFSASETLSFQDFHRDTLKYGGVVIIKSSTKNPTTVEAQGAKVTYKDGTSASWSGLLSFQYDKVNDHGRDWGGSMITVTGSVNGTSRKGVNFTADITQGIVFKNTCGNKHHFIPVSGIVHLTTSDNGDSTIDYGDGTCDTNYTITAGSQTTVKSWSDSM